MAFEVRVVLKVYGLFIGVSIISCKNTIVYDCNPQYMEGIQKGKYFKIDYIT